MSYDLILPLVHGYSITMVTLLRSKKIQCAVMQWKSQRSILPCAFFFFQAEDGIRDCHVTGVQTCALPIYDLSFEEWEESMDSFFEESVRVLKHGGSMIVFMAIIKVESIIKIAERHGLYYKTTGIWQDRKSVV